MNPDFAIQTPTISAPSERSVNWGGVTKGALIVTGVAVAAVVGYGLLAGAGASLAAAIGGNATASALAGGAMQGATAVAGWLGTGLNLLGAVVSGIPGFFVNLLGLQGTTLAVAQGATLSHGAGILGATAAGVVATHALVPGLHEAHVTATQSHITTGSDIGGTDAAVAPGIFAAGTGSHASAVIHEAAHAAHSAHEFNEEQKERSWTDKFSPKNISANFTDTIRPREQRNPIPRPEDNFAEQLNADKAKLDLALER